MTRKVSKDLDLWQFIADRLARGENVLLLVVAESSGSSPGRQGYKMAVGSDGELFGSIGGGVMEVNLVNQSRHFLSKPPAEAGGLTQPISEQVHQKHAQNSSGMICSGRQTVIFKLLCPSDLAEVTRAAAALEKQENAALEISSANFRVMTKGGRQSGSHTQPYTNATFETSSDTDFTYRERLGFKNKLFLVGGGHCALALCELLSRMDFRIHLFDDRPNLNTIEKNDFAHEIEIIESYESIADVIPSGKDHYLVVMTLGYKSDETVIKKLLDKDFKYFGVLGSRAKMANLMKSLRDQGYPADKLDRIHAPIGLPINSQTPEEIAVSIAAEIIAVKNSAMR